MSYCFVQQLICVTCKFDKWACLKIIRSAKIDIVYLIFTKPVEFLNVYAARRAPTRVADSLVNNSLHAMLIKILILLYMLF